MQFDNYAVGQTIRNLRKAKGISQDVLSGFAGIARTHLSMIENGERNPSDQLKEEMTKLYECGIADIFLALSSTKRLKRAKTKEVS